jgi:hypothetical protein
MINPKLINERNQIDSLFVAISHPSIDPYLQSLLTYYLCIRVTGFLENCVRIIFSEYSTTRASDHVSTYVSNKLRRFPNPTFTNICKITNDFNGHWKDVFKASVPSKIRQSLESINNNRNAIAHGGTSTITVGQLRAYYNDILILIDELEKSCV